MKEENVNTIQENQIVNYVKVPKFVFIIIIKHIVNYVKVRKFVFIINLNQLVKNVKIRQNPIQNYQNIFPKFLSS